MRVFFPLYLQAATAPHSGHRPGVARRSYPHETQRPARMFCRRIRTRYTPPDNHPTGAINATTTTDHTGAASIAIEFPRGLAHRHHAKPPYSPLVHLSRGPMLSAAPLTCAFMNVEGLAASRLYLHPIGLPDQSETLTS